MVRQRRRADMFVRAGARARSSREQSDPQWLDKAAAPLCSCGRARARACATLYATATKATADPAQGACATPWRPSPSPQAPPGGCPRGWWWRTAPPSRPQRPRRPRPLLREAALRPPSPHPPPLAHPLPPLGPPPRTLPPSVPPQGLSAPSRESRRAKKRGGADSTSKAEKLLNRLQAGLKHAHTNKGTYATKRTAATTHAPNSLGGHSIPARCPVHTFSSQQCVCARLPPHPAAQRKGSTGASPRTRAGRYAPPRGG